VTRLGLIVALTCGGLSCAEDESPCQELLARCEMCTGEAQLAVCMARANDRDQVRCSLALDDIRENCGTDGGMSRDQSVVDALPVGK
jgi:hypothetical protein